jgi:hypothetical protein
LFLERFTGTLSTPSLFVIIFAVVHTGIITSIRLLSSAYVKLAVAAAKLPQWQLAKCGRITTCERVNRRPRTAANLSITIAIYSQQS